MEENKKAPENTQKRTEAEQKEIEKKRKARERAAFKKKYFDYYDDIKISDRQDW